MMKKLNHLLESHPKKFIS